MEEVIYYKYLSFQFNNIQIKAKDLKQNCRKSTFLGTALETLHKQHRIFLSNFDKSALMSKD